MIAACLCVIACNDEAARPGAGRPELDASSTDMDAGAISDASVAMFDAASVKDTAVPSIDASSFVDASTPTDDADDSGADEDSGLEPSDAGGDASSPHCIAGEYAFKLSPVTGNCGHVLETYHLTFRESGVLRTTESSFDHEVVTETVVKGCSGRFSRTVLTRQGIVTQQLEAESLTRATDDALAGECQLFRYNELNQVACQGMYALEPAAP